ncbi:crotonyl-CoA carboxylase/reductase [Nonomuraea antimicrobica]|uniref:Crotonyl-CoA carboxylase/reductase n=1 Tax=Nonomuraea antimicrobica TaxID=561173 RepID=A0ABP7C9T5_9ACTN
MKDIADLLLSGEYDTEQLRRVPIPESFRGAVVLEEDADMFAGIRTESRDPAKSLTLCDVPTPEPGPGEALVAVMASSINYNTVWSAIFEPVPTFGFLKRYAKSVPSAGIHDRPFHVLGSDMSGVVLRTGPGVHRWRPGDKVVAHCLSVELSSPDGHDDSMLDPDQRIWGYETNYGGLAQLSLVKANQLMPKPGHLTWEEAAVSGLVHSTAYRQLISRNGANIKLGDVVLIWGAAGGLGSYATQLAVRAGAIPVCVVSSPRKAELVRAQGADLVIDRAAEGYRFWKDPETPDPGEWRRFGAQIRDLTGGDDPDVVFEHPGRETMGVSVYVARRGGTVVTCASTSGYQHQYDNRYLWMGLKRIVGTHFANYREAWEANRLIAKGAVHPTVSAVYGLDEVGRAARQVHANAHSGKIGVLCLAPGPGLGVDDPEFRAHHIDRINRFREDAANPDEEG